MVPECLASVSDIWTLFLTNGSGKRDGAIFATRGEEVVAYYSQNIVSAFCSGWDVCGRNPAKSGCYLRRCHWVWNVHIVSFIVVGITQVWCLFILLTWPEPEGSEGATNSNRFYSCLALVTGYTHQNCIHSTTYCWIPILVCETLRRVISTPTVHLSTLPTKKQHIYCYEDTINLCSSVCHKRSSNALTY